MGSQRVGHGWVTFTFSCSGAWALGCLDLVVVACGPNCPQACGGLPGPGIEPVSSALAGGFLTTGPWGRSLHPHLMFIKHFPYFPTPGLWHLRLHRALIPWIPGWFAVFLDLLFKCVFLALLWPPCLEFHLCFHPLPRTYIFSIFLLATFCFFSLALLLPFWIYYTFSWFFLLP